MLAFRLPLCLMHTAVKVNVDAGGLRIGLAVSRYHQEITDAMRDAAVETFRRCGGNQADLSIVPAAGTFELTAVCSALARSETGAGRPAFDALVAVGCIITGQTTHDQYIAQSVTQGLTAITIETGVPIAFGVLTCQNLEQARHRSIEAASNGRTNKGEEAMIAAIETARTVQRLERRRRGMAR